jgi:hypothetical protein
VTDPVPGPEFVDAIDRAETAWLRRSEQIGPLSDDARGWLSRALRRYRSRGDGSFDAWVADVTASIDEAADEVQRGMTTPPSGLAEVQAKYREAVE